MTRVSERIQPRRRGSPKTSHMAKTAGPRPTPVNPSEQPTGVLEASGHSWTELPGITAGSSMTIAWARERIE
eukprot:7631967-Pyramimonas_sp.AAC.1